MATPQKYVNEQINPAYVDHLENQIDSIRYAVNLVNSWIKDQTLGIYPSQLYLACLKDIRRFIE